ncbi:MAG TPA: DegT/DnrJ/EryC1/StrS family aminotransferase [Armatimonadetes bacterium]|nr:DegT/DnrJ/EryC1/StrS family aminotransferase [Armatimonadota bacterium]
MASDKLALLGGPKAVTRQEELKAAARWPLFGEEEKRAVRETLEGGNVYAPIAELERDFAAYHGVRFALAHNNGTSSIHSAYFAVGVGPGDEVITSAYTWHLQVAPILALHAIPVFCDVDPKAACLDPADIERKISLRTKAIAVLHPYGAVAPMDEILAVARRYGIPVIEDCSHAHAATYRGRKVGTLGDIGCFSLQASKLITAIEGGMLITDREEYYERACVLGHYERIPQLKSEQYRKYHQPEREQAPSCFGFKYRIHPLAAAIARVQLRHVDEWTAIRRRNMGYLTERLRELSAVFEPPYEASGTERVWLNYICQYHEERAGVPRERFIEALRAEGLPATGGRTGYLPVYWNPLYEERSMWAEGYPFDASYVSRKITYQRGLCPEAERFWRRTVGLPVLHWECSQELRDEIVAAVAKVLRNLEVLK